MDDLIIEEATVASLDRGELWVSTFQQSACSSCQVRAGCGQRLLSEGLNETLQVRVLAEASTIAQLKVGQRVTIGIARDVIAIKSLQLYLVPLVALVAGAVLGDWLFGSELATIASAVVALILSALYLRKNSFKQRCDTRIHPVLID